MCCCLQDLEIVLVLNVFCSKLLNWYDRTLCNKNQAFSAPLFLRTYYNLVPIRYGEVYRFYISMTKLLDADWLRGVQLFHQSQGSTVNGFSQNKQNGGKVFAYKFT